jgi:DNA-binding beta-propeller fold protein YncE
MNKRDSWRLGCSLVVGLVMTMWAGSASAKWYMVIGTLPNLVQVVDTTTDKVVRTIPLEGQGPILQISTDSATPRYAYATTNLDQAIAVVDLEQGKQVATYKLSDDTETVRVSATNLNPKGDRLYVSELPLKVTPGRYVHEAPRFAIYDTTTNKLEKTIPAPEQTMSFAFSPDGKRLYAFCVGQDVLVLDADDGHLMGTIPMANRNITGIRATYGLPLLANYQEQDYLITFAIIVEDSITNGDTLSLGLLDLKKDKPTLDVIETEPFVEDWYSVSGIATPADTHKAYFVWNDLWKVDYKTKKREAVTSLPNSQAVPLLSPDNKKLYCGGQWHSLFVYDPVTLKHIDDVELNHSMAGIGMRFVKSDKDLGASASESTATSEP